MPKSRNWIVWGGIFIALASGWYAFQNYYLPTFKLDTRGIPLVLPIGHTVTYTGSIDTYLGKVPFEFHVRCQAMIGGPWRFLELIPNNTLTSVDLPDGSRIRFQFRESCKDDVRGDWRFDEPGRIDFLVWFDKDMTKISLRENHFGRKDWASKELQLWKQHARNWIMDPGSLDYVRTKTSKFPDPIYQLNPNFDFADYQAVVGIRVPEEIWSRSSDLVRFHETAIAHGKAGSSQCYFEVGHHVIDEVYNILPTSEYFLFGGGRPRTVYGKNSDIQDPHSIKTMVFVPGENGEWTLSDKYVSTLISFKVPKEQKYGRYVTKNNGMISERIEGGFIKMCDQKFDLVKNVALIDVRNRDLVVIGF